MSLMEKSACHLSFLSYAFLVQESDILFFRRVGHFFSMACLTKTCVPLKTSGEKWEVAALESEDPYEYWIMVITVAAIMIKNTLSTNVLIG